MDWSVQHGLQRAEVVTRRPVVEPAGISGTAGARTSWNGVPEQIHAARLHPPGREPGGPGRRPHSAPAAGSRVQISGRVARPGSQAQPRHVLLITIVVYSKISMAWPPAATGGRCARRRPACPRRTASPSRPATALRSASEASVPTSGPDRAGHRDGLALPAHHMLPAGGHEHRHPRAVSADSGQRRLRRPADHARLVAGFVHVNPVSHLVTADRGLLGGQAAVGQVSWVLIASAALTAVFAPLTAWLYARPR